MKMLMTQLLMLMLPVILMAEPRWGILSTFPRPMPVHHTATVFPRIFTTNKSLNLPYLPEDSDIAGIGENRSFTLEGTLCFQIILNRSSVSPCISLYNQTAGWFDLPKDSRGPCLSANVTWLSGLWPTKKQENQTPRQPKWAPFCWGRNWGDVWPWTGCQSRTVIWADKAERFTFSPGIATGFNETYAGQNFSDQNPFQLYVSNPFDNWLLCGINGSCMNAEPLAMLTGGLHGVSQFSWSSSQPWGQWERKSPGEGVTVSSETPCEGQGIKPLVNITYGPTPVCVYPPFLFMVSEGELGHCTNETCFYSRCWNASTYKSAMVVRIPRWIPIPVEAPDAMSVFRVKRDFGITAALVTAIGLAITGGATAAVALSRTVNTAEALNEMSQQATEALDAQFNLGSQLRGGLMLVNQRIDLVQEQMDILWQIAQLGCEMKMSGLCITSVQYQNYTHAANLSRQLSDHLLGNWTGEFDKLMRKLRLAIVAVNSTRVDPGIAKGISTWFTVAMNHLKEWAGMGALTGIMIISALACLWCICRMRASQRREAAMIAQAFMALEEGQPPSVWLAALKHQ